MKLFLLEDRPFKKHWGLRAILVHTKDEQSARKLVAQTHGELWLSEDAHCEVIGGAVKGLQEGIVISNYIGD